MCVIWCLTRDRGSLSPLCALTDHITIRESYSVRRRSYGPAKEALREKQASSDRKKAPGGIRGDWTWRVLAVRFDSFFTYKILVPSCKIKFLLLHMLSFERHFNSEWSLLQPCAQQLTVTHVAQQVALVNVLSCYLCCLMCFLPEMYPPCSNYMIYRFIFWR